MDGDTGHAVREDHGDRLTASYRLLLFDLDGTLLTPERTIRPANRTLLAELMSFGVRIGIATGRGPRSAAPYVETSGASGPLILFNGAMVWDVAEARPVYQRGLAMTDALATISVALAHGVHINVYMDEEIWIPRTTETSRRSEIKDGVPHTVMTDLVTRVAAHGQPPIKLMLIDEQADVTRLIAPIRARLASQCTLVDSEPSYLEVMAEGVSKGSALEAITHIYGIAPAEVMAFGDERNDIDLVQRSGLGVAMANANPALRAVADIAIGHHSSDAIAEFLRSTYIVQGDRLVARTRPS